MSRTNPIRTFSALTLLLCFLVACGGGSGGDAGTSPSGSSDDSSGSTDNDGSDGDSDGASGGGNGDGQSGGGPSFSSQLIFAEGAETPGISGGEFTGLIAADINSSSFGCFSAIYTEDSSRSSALWCGRDGDMQPVTIAGDQIDNLPANISIERFGAVFVADNDFVLFGVTLDGASSGAALIEWDGQTTRSVLRVGELAPGFTEALAITSLAFADYSSAGAVISGTVGPFLIGADWHWNGDSVELISAFIDSVEAPQDQNGCGVRGIALGLTNQVRINNIGQIAYRAILETTENNTDRSVCRSTGIVIKNGDSFTTVLRNGATVPGTAQAEFIQPQINELFDSGALSISSVLSDDTASGLDTGRLSHWAWGPNDVANLFAITDESVPPTYEDRVEIIASVPIVTAASESVAVQHAKTALGFSLLAGPPHTGMPYPDIGAVGASSMSLIARSNAEAPPGFSADTYISAFSRPAIDSSGRVFYVAEVRNTTDDTATAALYSAQTGGEATLLIRNGDSIQVAGTETQISRILYEAAPSLSLVLDNRQGALISEQGDIWVPVELDGFGTSLLLISAR